eukprot:1586437-Pyramimonas_sp.AAC.1
MAPSASCGGSKGFPQSLHASTPSSSSLNLESGRHSARARADGRLGPRLRRRELAGKRAETGVKGSRRGELGEAHRPKEHPMPRHPCAVTPALWRWGPSACRPPLGWRKRQKR